MELEIVEVGPLAASSVAGAAEAGTSGPPVAQQFDSKELPQALVSEVRPFLRVANQIEAESPRVAYLCKPQGDYALRSLVFFFPLLPSCVAVGLRRWCGARDMFVEMPATLNVHVFTCCEPATRLALEISQKIEIRGGSGAICFSFGIFCPVPDPLPLEVDGRFHAFEKAHMMDPRSAGRGVRQFKIALLLRLEQDNKSTFSKRKEKNDGREIKSFYEKKKQVNAHELMPVLAEVLKALLIGTGGASGRFADRGADETPLAPVWKTSGPDSSCPAEIRRTAVGFCGGWRWLTRSKRNKAGGILISLIRGTAMETAVRGEATRLRRTPDPVAVRGEATRLRRTPDPVAVRGEATRLRRTPDPVAVRGVATRLRRTPDPVAVRGEVTRLRRTPDPVAATTGWSVAAAVQDNGGGIER